MNARAALILTGLAAAAAAVLIMTTRSADSPSRPARAPLSTAAADSTASGALVQPRPERPTLAAPEQRAGDASQTWTSFEDEERDSSWASEREQKVQEKIDRLLAESHSDIAVDHLECRSHQCRFHVGAHEASSFDSFVETLQGDRGFHGDASELLLQNYQPAGGDHGDVTVQVVLRYGRSDPTGAGSTGAADPSSATDPAAEDSDRSRDEPPPPPSGGSPVDDPTLAP